MIFSFFILVIGILAIIDPLKRSLSALHLFQLEGYDLQKYNKWLESNKEKCRGFGPLIKEDKTPLVMTDRAKRTLKVHKNLNTILFFGLFLLTLYIDNIFVLVLFVIMSFLIYYFEPELMKISGKINEPREKKINMGFYTQAQDKIKSLKNMKVVGITGSYGKTSTKFLTSTILNEKFKVQTSPSSFNTPMGLSKVINNDLPNDMEIFVAEMGAYVKGEIKEIADLVQPSIGIITSIGPAHLESFGSIENIIRTKYEIIEDLPEDGIAIFNYDDPNLKEVADKTTKRKYYYGIENLNDLDVYAKDISVNSRGSEFTLVIKELGEIPCSTRLLGRHNIKNLLAGCTVAYVLGMTLEDIKSGISKIEPVEHRLNLIDSGNGVIVIDDGFNSNPSGAKAALEVINEFKDGKKIVVTPGMIELGDIEFEENKKFGQEIAKVADVVFLIGKKRTKPIREGLLELNFPEEKIYSVDSLDEATKIFGSMLLPGDVILFENDLPDNYSEED